MPSLRHSPCHIYFPKRALNSWLFNYLLFLSPPAQDGTAPAPQVRMAVRFPEAGDGLCRALVEHALDPMIALGNRWEILFENRALGRLLGGLPHERSGQSLFTIVHHDDADRVEAAFKTASVSDEASTNIEFRVRRHDGAWLVLATVLRAIMEGGTKLFIVHARDLGARRQLEARLRHAQKLTKLGRLTVTIAYDFDSLITTMRMHVSTLLNSSDPNQPVPLALRAIKKAVETSASLTRQLLAFGSTEHIVSEAMDMHVLLAEVEIGIRKLVGPTPWLKMTPEATRTLVRAERESLQQVTLNLVMNVRDAMPAGSVVTIDTHNIAVPVDDAPESAGTPPVEFVVVEVSNTGQGRQFFDAQLFEPAFITSASGVITLGLVILHDIVAAAGGFVEVAADSSAGTTFRLFLPVV
jgi:two-component system, cell cycle sensor histidine kinase and response regulator CckA